MRSLKNSMGHGKHAERGFSLIEMLTVVAIVIIMASVTFISMVPVMKQYRVSNAYNLTLAAMRQARDNAISQRTSYSVTFTHTATVNSIAVAPTLSTFQGAQNTVTYTLPTDISFLAQSGLPAPGPDNYGTGATALAVGMAASSTSPEPATS
jgi:prepilin-type N-terminal cleavage/methylation domain-containing protein